MLKYSCGMVVYIPGTLSTINMHKKISIDIEILRTESNP